MKELEEMGGVCHDDVLLLLFCRWYEMRVGVVRFVVRTVVCGAIDNYRY